MMLLAQFSLTLKCDGANLNQRINLKSHINAIYFAVQNCGPVVFNKVLNHYKRFPKCDASPQYSSVIGRLQSSVKV